MKRLKIIFILFLWPALLVAQVPFGDFTLTTESNDGDQLIVVQGDTTVRMTAQTLLELVFPDQTDHNGDILYSDGTDPYWDDAPAGGGGGADTTYTSTDTINEKTLDHGVLIEGVLAKDKKLHIEESLYFNYPTSNSFITADEATMSFSLSNSVKMQIYPDRIFILQDLWPKTTTPINLGRNVNWWGKSYVTEYYVGNNSTGINKDPSDNLTFYDAVTGTKTLAELAAGGGGDGDSTSYSYTFLGTDTVTTVLGEVYFDNDDSTLYLNDGSGNLYKLNPEQVPVGNVARLKQDTVPQWWFTEGLAEAIDSSIATTGAKHGWTMLYVPDSTVFTEFVVSADSAGLGAVPDFTIQFYYTTDRSSSGTAFLTSAHTCSGSDLVTTGEVIALSSDVVVPPGAYYLYAKTPSITNKFTQLCVTGEGFLVNSE